MPKNYHFTEAQKLKISMALKGRPRTTPIWNKGLTKETHPIIKNMADKGKSPETCRKISEAKKGKPRTTPSWNKGLTKENDIRVKIMEEKARNSKIGKHHNLEWCQHISEGNKGKVFSDIHRKHISEGLKGKKPSLETRIKMSKNRKGKKLSELHKRHISEGLKTSSKIKRVEKLPPKSKDEIKKILSEKAKKRWSNPDYREKMLIAFSNRRISEARIKQWVNLHLSLKGRKITPEWRNKISVALIGNKNQEKQHSTETRNKISNSHKKLWLNPERRSGLFQPEGRYETKLHNQMKHEISQILEKQGFTVTLECPFLINDHFFVIDVFAKRNQEIIIVECGGCDKQKLAHLKKSFAQVIHLPFDQKNNIATVLQLSNMRHPDWQRRMADMKVLA